MGRPKGWVMSPEHKAALIGGRKKAKEEKIARGIPLRSSKKVKNKAFESVNGLSIMKVTGKEKDAFDFFDAIRLTFREKGDYISSPKIIKEIINPAYWQNVEWVKEKLSQFVALKAKE